MKLSEVLTKECIITNVSGSDKFDVLEKLVNVAAASDKVTDPKDLLKKVIERERLKSTGIGRGIGVPHAQTTAVTGVVACLGISAQGIEFNAIDGKPVHLVFLIATKGRMDNAHLGLLSRIARLFSNEDFKQKIINSNSPEEIMRLVSDKEKE